MGYITFTGRGSHSRAFVETTVNNLSGDFEVGS